MKHLGLLGRYLPGICRNHRSMQTRSFHIYTVDAHTLQELKLRRCMAARYKQKFPDISSQALRHSKKVELAVALQVCIMTLQKGRGGDPV